VADPACCEIDGNYELKIWGKRNSRWLMVDGCYLSLSVSPSHNQPSSCNSSHHHTITQFIIISPSSHSKKGNLEVGYIYIFSSLMILLVEHPDYGF